MSCLWMECWPRALAPSSLPEALTFVSYEAYLCTHWLEALVWGGPLVITLSSGFIDLPSEVSIGPTYL